VVHDLLPDESVDSGKPLPVSMLHEYAPVYSFKKKKDSMNRKTKDVTQEQEVTEGKKDGFAKKLRGLDADDYDICTSPRQYSYGGPYRRTRIGRKQIFKKEELSQVIRPYIQKDLTSLSMVHSARVKDDLGTVNSSSLSMVHSARVNDDVGTVNSSSLSMVHHASMKDDVGTVKSSDSPPGEVEKLISKKKCQKDDKAKNQQSLTVVNSVKSNDSEVIVDNEHGLSADKSVRSQDLEIQPSLATSLPAESDDCRKETNVETSSSSVSEPKSEILQHLSGRSVEESCILVDRDEFHSVFPDKMENDKHKPYKVASSVSLYLSLSLSLFCFMFAYIITCKVTPPYNKLILQKIRDAISSRMKQNREKEYKRLARQWYAEDVENGRECGDNPKPIEENQSSEESEWELL
jgi:metal-sulfur cluster biosynthetic enzyme